MFCSSGKVEETFSICGVKFPDSESLNREYASDGRKSGFHLKTPVACR